MKIERITHDPAVMGGKPCIRGLRVTVERLLDCWPAANRASASWRHTPIWSRKTSMRPCRTPHVGLRNAKNHWLSNERPWAGVG